MSPSEPFIRRPVGTTLLAIGLFLLGAVAYALLPVASLPAIELPTIRVSAGRPGTDPATMAATVAAPLERRIGEIAGLTELTSANALGATSITAQFDLTRRIDSAARDVQAALNAAAADLPADLPTRPIFRKVNPAAAPVLILALTSDTVPVSTIYDVADTIIAPHIARVEGIAEVAVNGAEQPAMRVRVDPDRLAAMGLSIDDVRSAIEAANVASPLGAFEGDQRLQTIAANDQLAGSENYGRIVVAHRNGAVVRLSDVAAVSSSVRNRNAAGWLNRKPAVLLVVTKQADANVIDTVDRVKALLAVLSQRIPAGIAVSVLSDRTATIRASVHEMDRALLVSIALVMMVVFVFLRRAAATVAAGVTVPLSLAGSFIAMWTAGFSIDNLSLMAITISVGFVVDDAIVMIENVHRHIEAGIPPLRAALEGAREIGFTVVSISLSLIAAFIPLLFMDGIAGRLLREFALTLTFAVLASMAVSLSVAPMICARFLRAGGRQPAGRFDRAVDRVLSVAVQAYAHSLETVLRHPAPAMLVFVGIVALTAYLYLGIPKGYFPQDDTGLIIALTEASPDISFAAMSKLQQQATDTVLADPAVADTGSFVGSSGNAPSSASVNQGRLFISLKPLPERGATTAQVVNRLRRELSRIPGIRLFMVAAQDLRVGARPSKGQFQYTLWGADLDDLRSGAARVLARLHAQPDLVDVSSDSVEGGLVANVAVDRRMAARLGVSIQSIDNTLNDAFAQRQISTIYTQRNQYKVVLVVPPSAQRDPSDLGRIYVPGADGTQVPLSSIVRIGRGEAPLVVNHQGQFPSITISFNLAPGVSLQAARAGIEQAVGEMHLPDTLHADFAGDARDFARTAESQTILIVTALLAVYIILGVLYESLIHPLTIISTLPSAGLGALIALRLAGMELTITAFIGIILLIGIVKKNGIMLVDFAIHAERRQGAPAEIAILEASRERFRPILMTTLAALLGAVPLAIASGAGSELRRPLGITIVGGLALSQVLTLYTTPVVYLVLSKLGRRHAASAIVADEAVRASRIA